MPLGRTLIIGMLSISIWSGQAAAIAADPGPRGVYEGLNSGLCPPSLSFCQTGTAHSMHAGVSRVYLNAEAVSPSLPLQLARAAAALPMPVVSNGHSEEPETVEATLSEPPGDDESVGDEALPRSVMVAMLALIGIVTVARRRLNPGS